MVFAVALDLRSLIVLGILRGTPRDGAGHVMVLLAAAGTLDLRTRSIKG